MTEIKPCPFCGHWTLMSDRNSIDRNGLPRVPATLTYEIELSGNSGTLGKIGAGDV